MCISYLKSRDLMVLLKHKEILDISSILPIIYHNVNDYSRVCMDNLMIDFGPVWVYFSNIYFSKIDLNKKHKMLWLSNFNIRKHLKANQKLISSLGLKLAVILIVMLSPHIVWLLLNVA